MAETTPPSSTQSPPQSPGQAPRPTLLTSLGEALTSDLNEHTFHFLHPRRIPWIQSPLDADPDEESEKELAPEETKAPQPEVKVAEPVIKDGHEHPHHHMHFGPDPFALAPDEPPLRFQTESSTIQLFYDLFFVANLTTFSAKNEVTDSTSLKAYVGYFALLWFTWLQVALFDIRFGHDSAFERVCKAVQFGVMVGLAVEGINYNLDPDYYDPAPFRTISFILMGSRLVLMIQYAVALWWLKGYKKARMPLLVHVGTMFVVAMICLGLAFGFDKHNASFVDGWYVTMGVEAVVILFVSGQTSFLNFRRTNIIERLGLLTLIILGEGIMGLGEQVAKIKEGDGIFSRDIIGLFISAVLIVYFIYMLYFDQTETKGRQVGSLRQQIWTVGHFPLHVCILLVVAGVGQFTLWRKINDSMNETFNMIYAVNPPSTIYSNSSDGVEAFINALNATLNANVDSLTWGLNYTEAFAEIRADPADYIDAFWTIQAVVASNLAEYFKVEFEADPNVDAEDAVFQIYNIYGTVFVYFFASAGLVLIILACIFMLGKKNKTRIEYVSAGVRLTVGTGLALLATMSIPWTLNVNNNTFWLFSNFFASPWLTPTVVLAYALVVGLDVVLILLSRMLYVRRGSVASTAV